MKQVYVLAGDWKRKKNLPCIWHQQQLLEWASAACDPSLPLLFGLTSIFYMDSNICGRHQSDLNYWFFFPRKLAMDGFLVVGSSEQIQTHCFWFIVTPDPWQCDGGHLIPVCCGRRCTFPDKHGQKAFLPPMVTASRHTEKWTKITAVHDSKTWHHPAAWEITVVIALTIIKVYQSVCKY